MAGGSHGLCGRAAPKPAAVGVSRGTGFVMGPFSEDSRVPGSERRCGAAARRGAQVSGGEPTSHQTSLFSDLGCKKFIFGDVQ